VCVPGHEGVAGNETAHQLAKIGSEQPFIEPEPACGISMGVAIKAIMEGKHNRPLWVAVQGP
jgi:hypothetical protein